MIASLGMYDLPPVQPANDRLWALIRAALLARGLPAPADLTRGPAAYWPTWEAPDLVLSQTCGLPFRACLHGRVTLVGTPDYGVEGCPPGYYRSVLVARRDDRRARDADFGGGVLAYNEPLSQSGWAAPVAHAAALGVGLREGPVTGGHQASAAAVADGQADIAALDAVTWALMQRHDPVAARLRVVGRTQPTPGLPLIAAPGADAEALFAAVAGAIAALAPADREALLLRGLVRIPAADYLALPLPPAPSQRHG